MSHWDYRVIQHAKNGQNWYGVYEVFFDENEQPESYGSCMNAESLDELRDDLELMRQALDKPVIHAHVFHRLAST